MTKKYRAIGLMSGTSTDGIDVALIETDGDGHVLALGSSSYPYEEDFRARMKACFRNRLGTADPAVAAAEEESTRLHAAAVLRFLEEWNLEAEDVDLIGFHGQTIWHNPADGETIQIGNGALLAELTGIPVVNDFRTADVLAGGQGAPLVPLYHRALAAPFPKPMAILNIGGVSNVTWIGSEEDDDLLAFDMGPGNALLNDWVQRHTGEPYDKDGELAASGKVDEEAVAQFLSHSYFEKRGPKSLDRDEFMKFMPEGLCPEDGAATLTMMTVRAIAEGLRHTGKQIKTIFLTGGGAYNLTMRRWLAEETGAEIGLVDDLGWSAEALEAEAFAYLAVRSVRGLPLSVPGTTGVPAPQTGGQYHSSSR